LAKGIIGGIERSVKYLMPLLFIFLIGMVIRNLTLPGAMEGVTFYLKPDFSKITPKLFIFVLGQVFFALSLGFGVLITLSSYLNKEENLIHTAVITGFTNTIIAVLCGFMIFPSLFTFGIEPNAGPTLVFQSLPIVFSHLWAGKIFSIVFFGFLSRSLSSLLSRMIDPEEFTAAQANMFATFNTVHSELLGIGAIVLLISAAVIWRERHRLDVYLLGRNQAINLGINYTRNTLWLLLWIAALVATATAVVGPVSFFGLLVAALANHFSPSVKHSVRLPMTFCVGGILLVGGQTIFEHFLGMQAVLSVVVEFAGGLVFLYLVLKKK